jgi:hypothetical protein
MQNISPKIVETGKQRIVEGRIFEIHESTGQSPDPALIAEVDRENMKQEHAALMTPQMSAVKAATRDDDRANELLEMSESLRGTIWECISPPPDTERLLFNFDYIHACVRNNVEDAVSSRRDYFLKVGVVPFIEVEDAEPTTFEIRGGIKRPKTGPKELKAKPRRENFPLSFFPLHDFLQTHKPIAGQVIDLDTLKELCACDAGAASEPRPVKERVPTVSELMQALAAALKPKPGTP